MSIEEAKYLDSILRRGGVSPTNVDDVPNSIITMLATYRYIRIVDKRSDGIAYLVETTDEGGQFLARGGFSGLIKESSEIKADQKRTRRDYWLQFLITTLIAVANLAIGYLLGQA